MSEEMMRDIIKRIKHRRVELGYSFQDLADLTGMSKSTLQRYEAGAIKNIPLDKLKILASALRVAPEWIMGWNETESAGSGGSSSTVPLAPQEEEIIDIFRSLNDEGQHRLIEYGDDLVSSGKYIKSGSDRLVEEA